MTAHVTLLEELRVASRGSGLPPARLYSMVTETAAQVLRLEDGEGSIRESGVADLIAVSDGGASPGETLILITAEYLRLVMIGGRVKLVSLSVARGLIRERVGETHLHPLSVEGHGKFLVAADVEMLIRTTVAALGPDGVIRLAGRRVIA